MVFIIENIVYLVISSRTLPPFFPQKRSTLKFFFDDKLFEFLLKNYERNKRRMGSA